MPYLPLRAAAKTLGVSAETLRRMCRAGCPAVEGGRGRGRGRRVDPELARAWQQQRQLSAPENVVRTFAALALDFHRRGASISEPGFRLLGIPEAKAAALIRLFISYASIRLLHAGIETPETALLEAIARATVTR